MSIVIIAIGQCGVTVADELYSLVAQSSPGNARFFRAGNSARCILVDTEAKVIRAVHGKQRTWQYDARNVYFRRAGAANNWAYGYHKHGSDFYELIRSSIRREARACPVLGGFVLLHSLAGGTGSGLGSRITERLRQDYPMAVVVNQVVWPYHRGEVIVQNYNMVLTLHHLYQVADMILVLFNDQLHQICSERLALKSVSFQDMNAIIARCLYNILHSCRAGIRADIDKDSSTTSLFDLVRAAVPHPHYKLVTMKYVPQVPSGSVDYTILTWQSLAKHLLQMCLTDTPTDERLDWTVSLNNHGRQGQNARHHHRFFAMLLLAKGGDLHTFDTSVFGDARMYPDFCLGESGLTVWSGKRGSAIGLDKWAGVVCNSTSIIAPLHAAVRKAVIMFHQGAFVHQYVRHGVTDAVFQQAFGHMLQGKRSTANKCLSCVLTMF
ncbi:Tubulin delta chain [Sorochytrium milnesiophthora]